MTASRVLFDRRKSLNGSDAVAIEDRKLREEVRKRQRRRGGARDDDLQAGRSGHAAARQEGVQEAHRRDAPSTRSRSTLVSLYLKTTYRWLGGRLDRKEDRALAARLAQADVELSSGGYRAARWFATVLTASASATLSLIVFGLLLTPAWWLNAVGIASSIATATTWWAFPVSLRSRMAKRRKRLERELPFALSELSVLASIGLSPIQVVRRMAVREHDPWMTREFRRVVARTDIQGMDLVAALGETAKTIPSQVVREVFWDLGNLIHQGGDLGGYLQQRTEQVLQSKRAEQEMFIEQLTTYADMYVTVVLIGVIFVGIAAFLMDAFGNSAGPFDADALLRLLTYGILPFIVFMVGMLLSSAHAEREG